jgi:hypothetical protein
MMGETAILNVEDFPDIDPWTEDGREEFTLIAHRTHREFPNLVHFIFKLGGEKIGEVMFTPPREWMH